MNEHTSFQSLRLNRWRQFDSLRLDLSSRLTILTGENGTGKTTLLAILGHHFDWYSQLVGTPFRPKAGGLSYRLGTDDIVSGQQEGEGGYQYDYRYSRLGTLSYTNGRQAEIRVPEYESPTFGISFEDQQQVFGLFLSSHRITSEYAAVTAIPVKFSSSRELISGFIAELQNRSYVTPGMPTKSPMLIMKESLIAAALYSEGNSSVSVDPEARAVWFGFQEVLGQLLPESLGFRRLRVDSPEIVIETRTGDFALEAVSGGLSAIFEIAWQVFLRSRDSDEFTVCFDEPENHLHPTLQRSFLPNLLRAFPSVKFIVATHSPFVVTSSPDAAVYVLTRGTNGVVANALDIKRQPVSAADTLREVLGVDSTLPIWFEERFDSILAQFSKRPSSPELFQELRTALTKAGISSAFPEATQYLLDEDEASE